jgi:hypothetical protein
MGKYASMEKLQLGNYRYSTCKIWGKISIFGFKNNLFTIKIMKGERIRLYKKIVIV